MAIGYRGSGTYTSRAGDNTTTLTVPQAAGTASGDLLLLVASSTKSSGAAVAINTPSGYTHIATKSAWAATTLFTTAVYYKVAGSSEPSASVTTASSSFLDARISAFTGVDGTTPIDANSAWGTVGTSTTVPVPAITTVTANAWWVCVGADGDGNIGGGAAPAGFTSRYVSTTFATQLMLASIAVATAGAQSATTFTRGTGGSNGGVAVSVALRESGATAATNHTRTVNDTVALADSASVDAPILIPEGVFLVAFSDPWNDPDPDWTRVDTLAGCRVRDWSIDRGRPTEFDKTGTGTAVVHIVDLDGLFDPTNTTSPYYEDVLPGRQALVQLQNPVGDSWHTLFRGFIESWSYRLAPTREWMEVELQLVDGFAILARAELQVGVDGTLPPFSEFAAPQQEALNELAQGNILYGETTGTLSDRITAILEDVDWPADWAELAVDIFSGNVNVGPKAYGPGTSALDALFDCVDAEFPGVANLYIAAGKDGRAGHLTFHGRQPRFRPEVAEYNIDEWTVGDPSAYTLDPDVVPVAELEWSLGFDNVYNAVSATPQWVGTGAAIRQLDPSVDNIDGQWEVDTASVTKYGRRSLTFDNLQTVEGIYGGNNSMQETKLFATFYKENFAEPAPRVSRMVFKTRRPGDPNGTKWWQCICNVEISDLLTLQTEHGGGGGFSDQYYVEGLHYACRPGGPDYPIVELTLDVSPRANYTTNPFDADEDP